MFNFLPYEEEFLQHLQDINYKGLSDMKPSHYSRWKKSTINNLNNKGNKIKKLYYQYLEENIDPIQFKYIIDNIKYFNKLNNLERYVDVFLKPSLKNKKSHNYRCINKKWIERMGCENDNELIEKAYENLDMYFYYKILCYLHSLAGSCSSDSVYVKNDTNAFLVKICSQYLNKKYTKYHHYIYQKEDIYSGIDYCLSVIILEIANYLVEYEKNKFNIPGEICYVNNVKGIVKTFKDFIPKISFYTYNIGKEWNNPTIISRNRQKMKVCQYTDRKSFSLGEAGLTGSRFIDSSVICEKVFKILSMEYIVKNDLNIKAIDNFYLKLLKDNKKIHSCKIDIII